MKDALDTIVRKFTNYRNHERRSGDFAVSEHQMYEALKEAGAALVDWKAITKGKTLFKRRNRAEINKRRDEILSNEANSRLPKVAAYQIALKELWRDAKQEMWEERAIDDRDDVFE